MAARIFRTIFYAAAGFFLYIVALIQFFVAPGVGLRLEVTGIFIVPAVVALFVGFACDDFRHKARDTGIVLLSVAAFMALLILTWVCTLSSPELRKMVPPETTAMFSDYLNGFAFLVALAVCGLAALLAGRKKTGQEPGQPAAPNEPRAGT